MKPFSIVKFLCLNFRVVTAEFFMVSENVGKFCVCFTEFLEMASPRQVRVLNTMVMGNYSLQFQVKNLGIAVN